MATRKVHRRARKILGEEPLTLVWCGLRKEIPRPPKDVHRAAGRERLKPGRHWLYYVGLVLAAVIIIPWFLIDKLDDLLAVPGRRQSRGRPDREPTAQRADGDLRHLPEPSGGVFDGDWELTAGQLLLRWYGQSPNLRRLLLLTPDRICFAASRGRRLSPTKADDFDIVTEYAHDEARIHREPGQRHFFLRFTDGSWLNLGRLADSEDADHFLKTISS
ncbi:hypothetical protein ACGFZB_36895 [Streptomyces cinerochromogenes]|uniref:YcxB-like protein domain-containing protein n=1 Tax=Streptomyces cinerochromogenes TaxID=66422 RepID=A0ABW7BFD2_9ACTN